MTRLASSRPIVLISLLSSACSLSHVERTIITSYGTYEMSGGETTQEAGDTAAGHVHIAKGMKLVRTTDRVPRSKGTAFGYQFVVEGTPTGSHLPVVVSVRHPPFQRPGQEQSEQETWNQTVEVGMPSYAGYSLDEEWKMVPGQWSVQVFHGPRLLAEKAFTVE